MEFLDKGMKGLLSGDLSSFAVKEIQTIIEKGLPKMESVQMKIQKHIEEEAMDLGKYYDEKLGISQAKQQMNQPVYSPTQIEDLHEQLRDQLNIENHLIKKQLQVKDEVDFVARSGAGGAERPTMPKFANPKNMELFMNQDLEREGSQRASEEDAAQKLRDAKLQKLEGQLNKVINAMYNDLARQLFKLDQFLLPVHGILRPDSENPMNLFKRQLKLEELSFELAHKKYRRSLDDLMRIGRADQLATSHRYMINWIKTIESAITEQQRIIVKRGSVDPKKDRLSFLLIQMPSDKMAALCIMHLMKHLF